MARKVHLRTRTNKIHSRGHMCTCKNLSLLFSSIVRIRDPWYFYCRSLRQFITSTDGCSGAQIGESVANHAYNHITHQYSILLMSNSVLPRMISFQTHVGVIKVIFVRDKD